MYLDTVIPGCFSLISDHLEAEAMPELLRRYEEPWRCCHTLEGVVYRGEVAANLNLRHWRNEERAALFAAILFRHAVYRINRYRSNAHQSALLAKRLIKEPTIRTLAEASLRAVGRRQFTGLPSGAWRISALLLDLDLCHLADRERLDKEYRLLESEYRPLMDEGEFYTFYEREARWHLDRSHLYFTEHFEAVEPQARENLKQLLDAH